MGYKRGPGQMHGRPKVRPKFTEISFPAKRANSQLTEELCTYYCSCSGNVPMEDILGFFRSFPSTAAPDRDERQKSRNFTRCLNRWCQGHLPVWVPAHSPHFLCVQKGRGRLDYMDQMCFAVSYVPIPIYLIWDSRFEFSFPMSPGELIGLDTVCRHKILGAWFHFPFPSQHDLEANYLSSAWSFPQLEYSHSTSA